MGEYKKLIQKTLALFMSVSLVSANFSTAVLAEEETGEDTPQTQETVNEETEENVSEAVEESVSAEAEQPEAEEPVITEVENTEETEPAAEMMEEKEESEPASEEEEVIDASEEKTEEQMNVAPDETGAYNLWVFGIRVTDANKKDILGDGKAVFNPDSNYLFFHDFDGERKEGIRAEGMDLYIGTFEEISLVTADYGIKVTGGNLTLNGDGEIFNVKTTNGPSVEASGSVEIRNGLFNISSENDIGLVSNELILGPDIEVLNINGNPRALSANCVPKYNEADYYVLRPEDGSLDTDCVMFSEVPYYKVEFNAGKGTGTMASVTVNGSKKYEVPECPFEGPAFCKFAGWSDLITGNIYQEKELVKITGNTILTATWQQVNQLEVAGTNVTYENINDILGDGTAKFDPDTMTLTIKKSGSMNVPKDSYLVKADGFDLTLNVDNTGVLTGEYQKGILVTNGNLSVNGNIVITTEDVSISVPDGNLTFGDGAFSMTSKNGYSVSAGQHIILSDKAVFNGKTESDSAVVFDPLPDFNDEKLLVAEPSDGILIGAKKVYIRPRHTYKVSFDANGETGTMEDGTAYEGIEFILPSPSFEYPESIAFAGWKAPDGTVYEAGKPVNITEDTKFTAQWKLKYTLKVAGVIVTLENKNDILNDGGKVKFDPVTNTLTMKDTTIEVGVFDNINGIEADGFDLTVSGENAKLYCSYSGIKMTNGNLSLQGNFDINTGGNAIEASGGNVVFKNGKFTLDSTDEHAVLAKGINILGDVELFDAGSFRMNAAEPGPDYDHERLYVEEPKFDPEDEGDALHNAAHIIIKKRAAYQVSFSGNGAAGTMETAEAYEGTPFKLPDNGFEIPEDMEFAGWEDSDGEIYQAGTPVQIHENTTFNAQWKLKYNLKVDGKVVNALNKNDILGDGKAKFDSATNTLTLNGEFNARDDQEGYAFVEAMDMNLRLEGKASITLGKDSDLLGAVTVTRGTLTLAGDFRLIGVAAAATGYGLTVESGELYAEAFGENGIALSASEGSLTIGDDVRKVEAVSAGKTLRAEKGYYISELLTVELPVNGTIKDGAVYDESGSEVNHFILTQKEQTEPVFSGHKLVLSGTLGLKFGVKFPAGFNSKDSYVTFTVNGKEQKVLTEEAEDGKEGKKVYTCSLNVLQMAENIEAVFHYGDNQTVSETYSLEKYFSYFEDHKADYSDKTLNLVHAAANYGYYAQPYLTTLHDLKDKYAKITLNYPVTFDYGTIKSEVAKYTFAKAISDSKVSAASYKLSLDADTALSVMVKVPEGTAVDMSASFGGKTYQAEKQSDTVWVVKITGIKATQLGETITVTGNAGGNFTITVSALSYVRSILEGGDKYSEDARKTVAALYQYYEAAENFKNS